MSASPDAVEELLEGADDAPRFCGGHSGVLLGCRGVGARGWCPSHDHDQEHLGRTPVPASASGRPTKEPQSWGAGSQGVIGGHSERAERAGSPGIGTAVRAPGRDLADDADVSLDRWGGCTYIGVSSRSALIWREAGGRFSVASLGRTSQQASEALRNLTYGLLSQRLNLALPLGRPPSQFACLVWPQIERGHLLIEVRECQVPDCVDPLVQQDRKVVATPTRLRGSAVSRD